MYDVHDLSRARCHGAPSGGMPSSTRLRRIRMTEYVNLQWRELNNEFHRGCASSEPFDVNAWVEQNEYNDAQQPSRMLCPIKPQAANAINACSTHPTVHACSNVCCSAGDTLAPATTCGRLRRLSHHDVHHDGLNVAAHVVATRDAGTVRLSISEYVAAAIMR